MRMFIVELFENQQMRKLVMCCHKRQKPHYTVKGYLLLLEVTTLAGMTTTGCNNSDINKTNETNETLDSPNAL